MKKIRRRTKSSWQYATSAQFFSTSPNANGQTRTYDQLLTNRKRTLKNQCVGQQATIQPIPSDPNITRLIASTITLALASQLNINARPTNA
jgi:hypothetical protein